MPLREPAEYLRRLAELPAPFREDPRPWNPQGVPLGAMLGDLYETLVRNPPPADFLKAVLPRDASAAERNRIGWVSAACWLLMHPDLRTSRPDANRLKAFLADELRGLAAVAHWDSLADGERREELLRRTLRMCRLTLPGESAAEADDRLTQLDSVGRDRLVRDAAERDRLRRELQAEMARRAAEEAAARYSPE